MDERPCFVCAAMDLALPSGVRVPIASMQPAPDAKSPVSFERNTVLGRLLSMAGRRKPKNKVLIHSDQGSQFTSSDWASFLRAHNLEHSMSRRGNCHGNALAESFFNLLKRERIRRRVYKTRP
jgi:transposase InsO family protein